MSGRFRGPKGSSVNFRKVFDGRVWYERSTHSMNGHRVRNRVFETYSASLTKRTPKPAIGSVTNFRDQGIKG